MKQQTGSLFLASLLISSTALAVNEWRFSPTPPTVGKLPAASEKEFNFTLGKETPVKCTVSATKFQKLEAELLESRTMTCFLPGDMDVFMILSCSESQAAWQQLTFRIKKEHFGPILNCGPKQ